MPNKKQLIAKIKSRSKMNTIKKEGKPILIQKKEIKLGGQGGVAIIDANDYELLSGYNWSKNKKGYVIGTIDGKQMRMHVFLMTPPKGKIVDHINRNRCDNRRKNLRITNKIKGGNGQNRSVRNTKSNPYRGVYYDKKNKKYYARIYINNKCIYLGRYDTAKEAAEMIDMYVVHNNNEFIQLNFPEKRTEYLKRKYISFISKKNESSSYIGIHKTNDSYVARIQFNGKRIHIGIFADEIDAAKAIDEYIVENNIPNRTLNFPEEYPDYDPRIVKTEYETIDNNTVRLLIKSQPDKVVLIDKDDYEDIKYFKCFINSFKNKISHVSIKIDNKLIILSRFLMNETDPEIYIDHIDSNPLNNTRKNLRLSNKSKNVQNCKKRENTSSKYIGVSFNKNRNIWMSIVSFNNIVIHKSINLNEIHAARQRDLFILKYLPDEHYKMNFEWTEQDIEKWEKKLPTIISPYKLFSKLILKNTKFSLEALSNNNFKKIEMLHKILCIQTKLISEVYGKLIDNLEQKIA